MSTRSSRTLLGLAAAVLLGCSLTNDLNELSGDADAASAQGGAGASAGADASAGAGGSPVPSGPHFGYVADAVSVPTTDAQAAEFALDLDGDGAVDNQLGQALGSLGPQAFDVQSAVDEAVAKGQLILLLDFQAPNFTSASGTTGAGLEVKFGASPSPAACTNPADITTCGKHLDGAAAFQIAADSPATGAVAGEITNGVFSGGPGKLSLKLFIAGIPFELNLIGARAKASGMSESALSEVIVAGGLTQDELDTHLFPSLHAGVVGQIALDCTDADLPDCGCASGSLGGGYVNLFDTNPKDCVVTVEEIKNNPLILQLLAPDIVIDGTDALSVGIKLSAVKAQFAGVGP